MLTHILVRNFAIVEALELEFHDGLTVLTGETGAGKSILLDALGLALGDRADSGLIRHGAERAEVAVSFDISHQAGVLGWLKEHELDSGDECIIRRTVNRKGPSRAYINGQSSTVQTLRELGEQLVDLHGQHEHQSLLKRASQRQILDSYAGNVELLDQLRGIHDAWQHTQADFDQLANAHQERAARLDLLRFQVDEMEQLELREDEMAGLETDHKRLANASELASGCTRLLTLIADDDEISIQSLLNQARHELQQLADTDASLGDKLPMLEEADIQLQELASDLRHYQDQLAPDPARLTALEERLSLLHQLSRKHNTPVEELPALLARMQAELAELENSDIRLEELEQRLAEQQKEYRQLATRLHERRQRAAAELSTSITAAMQELGMEGGHFDIQVNFDEDAPFSRHGLDRIEFLVSANAGQPAATLGRVASGGELSRISLAIQVNAVEGMPIPTLIFDEVDVGIGGRVAEIVGRKLRGLAAQRQVICVTHLPQVAALGHNHMQVSKQTADQITVTQIHALSADQRVDEIARMLGGLEITEQTVSHARELIERADAV
ncbi:MAG TPA: DNA repair protein RecN [Gammaproteobacteria bacterium]|nr:DNA repair protein RecN [Gammaproteobacteria bacterium]